MENKRIIILNKAQLNALLDKFQKLVNDGVYTEKIPYATWRSLKKLDSVYLERVSYFVTLFEYDADGNRAVIYSDKTYNHGFARFYRDEEIKERENMKLNSYTTSTNTSGCAISASSYAVGATDSVAGKVSSKTEYTLNSGLADASAISAISYKSYNDDLVADKVAIAGDWVKSYTYDYEDDTVDALVSAIKKPSNIIAGNPLTINEPAVSVSVDGTHYEPIATKADVRNAIKDEISALKDGISTLQEALNTKVDKAEFENRKEKEKMKGFNFDFGPCGSTVRMSMYGLAIQNVSGEWVSYNPATQEIVNVDVFNIPDGGKYMYKMPVAISEIAIGDIVVHNRKPAFVTSISADGKSLGVVDPYAGERKDIMLTRSPFGFNFATKVISLFGAFGSAPTAEAPFGNMLPFLMMSEGNGADFDPMLMYMMMQGQNGFMNGFNPMMMYFLIKNSSKDIDPWMMAMMMNAGVAPTNVLTNAVIPAEQV